MTASRMKRSRSCIRCCPVLDTIKALWREAWRQEGRPLPEVVWVSAWAFSDFLALVARPAVPIFLISGFWRRDVVAISS